MGWQTLITTLTTGLAILSFGAFCLLVGLYWLNERRQKATYERAKADLADTALLFQTMRDVVRQQKKLAKEFNSDLDAKITGVKQVLARSLEKNEKLFERQRALTAELEEAKAQLASLQAQLGRTSAARNEAPEPAAPPRTADALAQLTEDLGRARKQATARKAPIEPDPNTLRATGRTTQPASKWERAPLDAPAASEPATPAPEPDGMATEGPSATGATALPQATPEEAEAARQAFRALLNLEAGDDGNAQAAAAAHANGASNVPPLQQRVLEYQEAGMPVADIAKELGIGKGEVRLMLSLAKRPGNA